MQLRQGEATDLLRQANGVDLQPVAFDVTNGRHATFSEAVIRSMFAGVVAPANHLYLLHVSCAYRENLTEANYISRKRDLLRDWADAPKSLKTIFAKVLSIMKPLTGLIEATVPTVARVRGKAYRLPISKVIALALNRPDQVDKIKHVNSKWLL